MPYTHEVTDSMSASASNWGRVISELPKIRNALVEYGMNPKARVQVVYDAHQGRLALEWTDVRSAPHLREGRICVKMEDSIIIDQTLCNQPFPPTTYGTMPARTCPLNGFLDVKLSFSVVPTYGQLLDEDTSVAAMLAASMREQVPHGVRFVFAGTGNTLWTSEAVLTERVPLFKPILSSEFAEGQLAVPASGTAETSTPIPQHLFEDSDDETDELLQKSYSTRVKERTKPVAPGKTITVVESAYTTYAAVLLWIMSHKIDFAPLKSTGTEEPLDSNAFLPAPASPKSVFRLAHLLELKDLQDLAVTEFASQLTRENAAEELFSDVACAYPEIRDAALAFICKYDRAVKASEGWKQVIQRADQDALPSGASHVALLLADRLL